MIQGTGTFFFEVTGSQEAPVYNVTAKELIEKIRRGVPVVALWELAPMTTTILTPAMFITQEGMETVMLSDSLKQANLTIM